MQKAPEEGRIWEWRAFGSLPEELIRKVQSNPIRMGIRDVAGEDVYLVSPASDQNVKLRQSQSGWTLKFKLLIETREGGFDLFEESAAYTYCLPVGDAEAAE